MSLFGAGIAELDLLGLNNKFKKNFSSFAEYTNKTFQMLNAFKNITVLFPRNDFFNALGHTADFILPAFVPMKDFYLTRGVPLGLYVGAHSSNIINEKEEFLNYKDYFEHQVKSFKKTLENFSIRKPGLL